MLIFPIQFARNWLIACWNYKVKLTNNKSESRVTQWKKLALEGLVETVAAKNLKYKDSHECEIKDLYAKIGQLSEKRDLLAKASGR